MKNILWLDELTKPLFAEQEKSNECGLQEKRECALHGQGLTDDVARISGGRGPVRAELELEWDARDL